MDKEKIRERLVELLAEQCRYKKMKCVGCDPEGKYYCPKCKTEQFGEVADHLIANGATFCIPLPSLPKEAE